MALPAVYFLQHPYSRLVKIGFTTDLSARQTALECGAGCELYLIRHLDGGRPTERWLHGKFAAKRRRGEWFEFDEAMMSVRPPDEVPVIPRVVVRRDVRLTVRERVREVRREIGDLLGMGAHYQLLQLATRLTDEEAEEALRHLFGYSTADDTAKAEAA